MVIMLIRKDKLDQIIITVFVKPSSKKAKNVFKKTAELLDPLIEVKDDAMIIHLKSPASKGKANKELITRIANFFEIKTGQVRISRGHTSTTKQLVLDGITLNDAKLKMLKFQ